MSALLASPDFGPHAFVIADESQTAVEEAVSGWMKAESVVRFNVRPSSPVYIDIDFGNVRTVVVSAAEEDFMLRGDGWNWGISLADISVR